MTNFGKKMILGLLTFWAVFGLYSAWPSSRMTAALKADNLSLDDQEATIRSIKKASPAVVNISIISPVETAVIDENGEEKTVTEKQTVTAGTGFLISADGLILTNKHLVYGTDNVKDDYRVMLSTGKKYYAQLIGNDPLNDLAVLKIFDKNLPYIELGNSDKLEIGQTAIAIGNSLGRYPNSVTKGIISGVGRDLTVEDYTGNFSGLDSVIQTDAEINPGNSGGPLIDLNGRVIGVNVAYDSAGVSIGFAIPINDAKPVINSVIESGRIIRPLLGLRYQMITPEIAEENGLTVEEGALVVAGEEGEPAVVPDSPAAKAGIQEGDIITEVDAVKLNEKKSLTAAMLKYKPGQKMGLRVWRNDEYIVKIVTLGEFK